MTLKLGVLPLLLSALLMDVTARADEHSAIVPYVTDDVIALAYFDLTKIDMAALLKELQTLGAVPSASAEDSTRQVDMFQSWLQQLIDQGTSRVYVLLRMADLQHGGPSWVIPVSGETDPAAMMRLMPQLKRPFLPSEFRRVDGAVLAASHQEQLQQLATRRAATSRADLMPALDALGQADAALIVWGDADSRRVLREMFPSMPPPFQAINGRMFADGIRWAGLAVDLPPEPKVVLHVEAARPDTAITLRDSAVKLLQLAEARSIARWADASPDLQAAVSELLGLLKPQTNDATLTLTLGGDAEELGRMRTSLATLLDVARGPAERSRRIDQLKQISLAFCIYESVHGSLVQSANYDASGKPLLSWRVHLLPYLEESAIYAEFHLDEPWDSSHNRQLIERMPQVYADPSLELRQAIGAGRTTFVAPIAAETLFPPRTALPEGAPLRMRDVKDGPSRTIAFVEVVPDKAVVWTQPDDWNVRLDNPLQGLVTPERSGFVAAFADAHVRYVAGNVSAEKLRAWLTRAGAEPAD